MKRAARKLREESAWEQAGKHGVDMSLLAANRRRTPAERLTQHARALATVQMLREGMAKRRG